MPVVGDTTRSSCREEHSPVPTHYNGGDNSGLRTDVSDGREGRIILSQCLLDAVGVERGDVATVRGVLDG
jgi:hypothetical protein